METCLHTKIFQLKAQNSDSAVDRYMHSRRTAMHNQHAAKRKRSRKLSLFMLKSIKFKIDKLLLVKTLKNILPICNPTEIQDRSCLQCLAVKWPLY